MDVDDLAPALLSLSALIKETNHMVNGDRTNIKIVVNTDLEQNCFELNVELVMSILDNAKNLLFDPIIKTAKEIAEWVGIIVGTPCSLYAFIKWLKGKKIDGVTTNKDNSYTVNSGKDSIKVSAPVYNIYASPSARKKALDVLEPLRKSGYDKLEFYKGDEKFMTFKKDDIPEKDESDLPLIGNLSKAMIQAKVRIRKPDYEGRSQWTLVYKGIIRAQIADEEWLKKFQANNITAPPGTSLYVDMEEQFQIDEDGKMLGEASYTVVKVYKVIPPEDQLL